MRDRCVSEETCAMIPEGSKRENAWHDGLCRSGRRGKVWSPFQFCNPGCQLFDGVAAADGFV